MEFKQEEVRQWKTDLVTAELLKRAKAEIEDSRDQLEKGDFIDQKHAISSMLNVAILVGYIRGLRWFTEFKGDDSE